MSLPAKIHRNIHPKELERFHRFNNRYSYRYWSTVATVIAQKKSTRISLNLLGLNCMLLEWAKLLKSFTKWFITGGELRGITSNIVRSSTYWILGPKEPTRSSTMTANKMGLTLVPWGIPPLGDLLAVDTFASWTRWDLPCKKAATHLTKEGCNWNPESVRRKIRCSMRSKPFLKSAKRKHNAQFLLSRASSARWS